MRFDAVKIARYGRLADLTAGVPSGSDKSSLPAVVVVLGPNESGKSTFFSFLTTLLYGFKPAARERHPYAPWDGGDPEGWARIALDDGSTLEVSRRLRSSPTGTVVVDGRAEELRNRPLEAARHVPRVVYRQVYALGLSELAALQGEARDLVQDRLAGALGSPDLRPARVVAGEFDSDADALWRPNRRGRPVVRGLHAQLKQLAVQGREARARDQELRRKVEERAAAETKLETLRERRDAVRKHRRVLEDRLNRLRPVARALARIRELREAGSGEFAELPADPRERLAALRLRRQDAEDRIVELRQRAADAREAIREHAGHRRQGAETEALLREAARLAAELGALEADAAGALEEVDALAARCEEQARRLFSVPLDEIEADAVEGLQAAELHVRLEELANVRAERRVAEEGLRAKLSAAAAQAEPPGKARLATGLVAAVVGGGLGAVSVAETGALGSGAGVALGRLGDLLPGVAAPVAATVLVALGLAVAAHWVEANRRVKIEREAMEASKREDDRRIDALRKREAQARGAMEAAVGELPVRPALLDGPDLGLATSLERMAELAARRKERFVVLEERRRTLEETRGEIGRLAAKAGATLGGAGDVQAVLAAALEAAAKVREEEAAAHRELERAEGEAAEAVRQWEGTGEALRVLEVRLAEFGDGDPDQGAEAVAERMEARDRSHRLEDELGREHPGRLDDMAAEVGEAESQGETWDGLEDDLEAEVRRKERLDARAEELREAIGRLDSDIAHLGEGETADEVEGRVQVVRARIGEAEEARDRAFLLARVVEEGDRRFRDRHQPTLLLRAGEHLREITGGRYHGIKAGSAGDRSFYVNGPSEPVPRRVEGSLSQGTREQVYLALRLAVVDHLDEGEERLPLVMDETLVNWDATRRDRAFDLLEQVGRNRQVFLFTCHPAMAAEMEDRGAHVVALNRSAA